MAAAKPCGMALPVSPPLAPMLARAVAEVPEGGYAYEPKWDGFRCLAFRDGDEVDLRSRHDRGLARYFPEVVEGLLALPATRFVLDGEIVPAVPGGFDFAALMRRLHPSATRVARLRQELPAAFVAFDLLAIGESSLLDRPFADRRAELQTLLAGFDRAPILLTPTSTDAAIAHAWLSTATGAGVDGVVAKPLGEPYAPGRRTMLKVKAVRTADCVVAGVRLGKNGLVGTLLLGLYDEAGGLRHVGVVMSMAAGERREATTRLFPLRMPIEAHPWRDGFLMTASPIGRLKGSAGRWTPDMELDWAPLRPEAVVEVAFTQVDEDRFRHPARLVRWRPDRPPDSCRLDQLAIARPPLHETISLS